VAITVEELRKGTMIDVPKETRDILYQGQWTYAYIYLCIGLKLKHFINLLSEKHQVVSKNKIYIGVVGKDIFRQTNFVKVIVAKDSILLTIISVKLFYNFLLPSGESNICQRRSSMQRLLSLYIYIYNSCVLFCDTT
jgi:hypothetical protein